MSKIADYMSSPVLTTTPDSRGHDAVEYMYTHNIGALLVKENEQYVGIITKADWMHKVLRGDGDPSVIKVSTIMTAPILTLEKKDSLAKASDLMKEKKIRHVAVTDKEKIVGMLSIKDLERYYQSTHR